MLGVGNAGKCTKQRAKKAYSKKRKYHPPKNKEPAASTTHKKVVRTRYYYHLSDDTKHDGIFVDQVLRNSILKYDNASSQYKNKLHFGLLRLPIDSEFNLRIIRTDGAAGDGKGGIDVMLSFGAKNVLRKDIVTHDVFFNTSEEIANYLSIKNPQFSYTTIKSYKSGKRTPNSIELANCMKQHRIVFIPYGEIICKEYLCDCTSCLQLKFSDCFDSQVSSDHEDDSSTVNEFESDEDENNEEDEDIDHNQQIFDFVEVPSYVSLVSQVTLSSLYISLRSPKKV